MEAPSILRTGEPVEVREFELGRLELYRIGSAEIGRAVYEPGWRWSEHVRPIAGTDLCEVSHVGVVLDGAAGVRMRDGYEFVISAGDFFAIPEGHDSWVVGDGQYVSLHLSGADAYAAPAAHTDGEPDLEGPSELMRLVGLRFDELAPDRVSGHLESGSTHHQPWGLVHGGLLATVIETAATTGGYIAVRDSGLQPVGITNTTHFLRSHQAGRLDVTARAVHRGKSGQLWTVDVSRAHDHKPVAVGNVRLQNLEPRHGDAARQRGSRWSDQT
jgi:uncharacterized protein (TIGR00369 family)